MPRLTYLDALQIIVDVVSKTTGDPLIARDIKLQHFESQDLWPHLRKMIVWAAASRTGLFEHQDVLTRALSQLTTSDTIHDVAEQVQAWSLAGDKNPPTP